MRLAQSERDDFAFEFRAVADAHNVELFLEAQGYAVHGVSDQRARQSMQRAVLLCRTCRSQDAVFVFKRDPRRQGERQFPLRPLNIDASALQRHLHTRWHWNWFAPDS